eukprot:9421533-Lingulodinium_polyedra.AAC.1
MFQVSLHSAEQQQQQQQQQQEHQEKLEQKQEEQHDYAAILVSDLPRCGSRPLVLWASMAPKAKKGQVVEAKRLARAVARAELGARSHRKSGVAPDPEWLQQSVARILSEKFAGWPEILITGT